MQKKIRDSINKAVRKFSNIKNLVKMVGNKIRKAVKALQNKIKGVTSSVKDKFTGKFDKIKKKIEGLKEFIKNFREKAGKIILEKFSFLQGPLKKLYEFYTKYGKIINLVSYIPVIILLYPHAKQLYNKFKGIPEVPII